MKALLIAVVVASMTLTACSNEKEHTKEENMKRNDTSNHPTDIGKNKSY